MRITAGVWCLCLCAASLCCASASAQRINTPISPRWLLNTSVGGESDLGYEPPSKWFGPSIEVPIASRFEFDADASYSPDKKVITNNGNQLETAATGIVWLRRNLGFSSSYTRNWLWTSQFTKAGWSVLPGIVVRNDFQYFGRFSAAYLIPTGCVWATPSNPCRIQSPREQGPEISQQFQIASHLRFGVSGAIVHYCDQSNPAEPTGRTCHFGAASYLNLTIEFPGARTDEPY